MKSPFPGDLQTYTDRKLALGGPDKVAEWDAASKGKKLPERVAAPKGAKSMKSPRKPFGSFAP